MMLAEKSDTVEVDRGREKAVLQLSTLSGGNLRKKTHQLESLILL